MLAKQQRPSSPTSIASSPSNASRSTSPTASLLAQQKESVKALAPALTALGSSAAALSWLVFIVVSLRRVSSLPVVAEWPAPAELQPMRSALAALARGDEDAFARIEAVVWLRVALLIVLHVDLVPGEYKQLVLDAHELRSPPVAAVVARLSHMRCVALGALVSLLASKPRPAAVALFAPALFLPDGAYSFRSAQGAHEVLDAMMDDPTGYFPAAEAAEAASADKQRRPSNLNVLLRNVGKIPSFKLGKDAPSPANSPPVSPTSVTLSTAALAAAPRNKPSSHAPQTPPKAKTEEELLVEFGAFAHYTTQRD